MRLNFHFEFNLKKSFFVFQNNLVYRMWIYILFVTELTRFFRDPV